MKVYIVVGEHINAWHIDKIFINLDNAISYKNKCEVEDNEGYYYYVWSVEVVDAV